MRTALVSLDVGAPNLAAAQCAAPRHERLSSARASRRLLEHRTRNRFEQLLGLRGHSHGA